MTTTSRRDFLAIASRTMPALALISGQTDAVPRDRTGSSWDLSWVDQIKAATDRALFDWATITNPGEDIVPQIAERYLDNCAAAYATGTYKPVVVFNARTRGIAAGMNDGLWARYSLGDEYSIKDAATGQSAVRNPFWTDAAPAGAGTATASIGLTLQGFVKHGAIILVCDFAVGHLSNRLATKAGRAADDVHQDIRDNLVPGAYLVPSGIFGLARAQNAGCAFIRM